MEVFNKSIVIFPSYYYRGAVLEKIGRLEEAIDSLTIASEIDQNYVCDDLIGFCYIQLKEYEKEVRVFEKAVQINPDFCNGIINQAQTLRYLGRFEESVNLALSIIRFFPACLTLVKDAEKLKEEGKIQDASDLINTFVVTYKLGPNICQFSQNKIINWQNSNRSKIFILNRNCAWHN